MKKVYLIFTVLTLVAFLSCGDDGNPVDPFSGNPEGRLYVLNQNDNTLYIYDTKTMARIDSINTVVDKPHYIEFSPDKLHYYITTFGANGTIAKYDAVTNTLTNSVSLVSFQPTAIAITDDSRYGYVCNFASESLNSPTKIYKFDLSTMTLVDSMQAGAVTHDVKITSDGSVVIAVNRYSDNVTLVYPDADTVTFVSVDPDVDYPLGSNNYGPFGVIIDNNDSLAYIACADANQIRVLDIKNRIIIDSVDIPNNGLGFISGPTLLAVSPDNSHVFVTTRLNNTITVIKTNPLELVTEIAHETPASFGIDISDDGSRIYAACINTPSTRGRIYVIDGKTFEKIDSLDVGRESFGLRWQPKKP